VHDPLVAGCGSFCGVGVCWMLKVKVLRRGERAEGKGEGGESREGGVLTLLINLSESEVKESGFPDKRAEEEEGAQMNMGSSSFLVL